MIVQADHHWWADDHNWNDDDNQSPISSCRHIHQQATTINPMWGGRKEFRSSTCLYTCSCWRMIVYNNKERGMNEYIYPEWKRGHEIYTVYIVGSFRSSFQNFDTTHSFTSGHISRCITLWHWSNKLIGDGIDVIPVHLIKLLRQILNMVFPMDVSILIERMMRMIVVERSACIPYQVT